MQTKHKELKYGSKGVDVSLLHRNLKKLGYQIKASEIREVIYHRSTAAQVKKFQREHGLEATGRIDENTASCIEQEINERKFTFKPSDQHAFVVNGRILTNQHKALPGVIVRAFDKDFRNEQSLGSHDTTNRQGKYEIHYTRRHFCRDEKLRADLFVRAYNREGMLLAESDVHYNADEEETIELSINDDWLNPSEYQKFLHQIKSIIEDTPLSELTETDIGFLAGELELGENSVNALLHANELSQQTTIPAEVFYTWTRVDAEILIETILNQENEAIEQTLYQAIEANVIASSFVEKIDAIIEAFKQLRQQYGVSVESNLQAVTTQVVLRNKNNNQPLAQYRVNLAYAGGDEVSVLTDITDARGLAEIQFVAPLDDDQSVEPQRFSVSVTDPEGETISPGDDEAEIRVTEDNTQFSFDLDIPLPVIETHTISTLTNSTGLTLPRALSTYLNNNHIQSLADIRSHGGLASNAVPAALEQIKLLNSHAELELVSEDIGFNAILINHDYGSILKIVNTPARVFLSVDLGNVEVENLKDKLKQIHAKSKVLSKLSNNILTNLRTEAAGNPINIPPEIAGKLREAEQCGCKDCESAISPLAYLVELLKYTFKVVYNNRQAIDLIFLQQNFHQLFGELPTACRELNKEVRQVRIAIEVLRSSMQPSNQSTPSKAEHDYLLKVYQNLLTQFGTSYGELRNAVNTPQEERDAVASKLGIHASAIDDLFIQPSQLKEIQLDMLFGMSSTVDRHPLSDGASDDPNNHIRYWQLENIRWNKNTDNNGYIHVFVQQVNSAYHVNLYRDVQHNLGDLVGHGVFESSDEAVVIAGRNFSDLTGNIWLNSVSNGAHIVLSAVPLLLSWRLQSLRSLWLEKDKASAEYNIPLIDPDLIDEHDIVNPSTAYTLWENRQQKLKELLDGTNTTTGLNQVRSRQDFDTAINSYLGNTIVELRKWRKYLDEGKSKLDNGTYIDDLLQSAGLDNGGFNRLIRMDKLLKQQGVTILSSEWEEIYHILIQAEKRRNLYTQWHQEEKNASISLSPEFFRLRDELSSDTITVEPPTLLPWRSDIDHRIDWEDKLEARIEQENTLINEHNQIIDNTEQNLLTTLRDILVDTVDTSNRQLSDKAKELSQQFLIDMQSSGCQKTTRVGQAISTLQKLIWATCTGQLNNPYPGLTIESDQFDEEWNWMGSYEKWRAAMFVFMYPENVLNPNLKPQQTPVFRQIVKNLQRKRLINPAYICKQAKLFEDYYNDVASLEVKATCYTNTVINKGDCHNRETFESRNLFYMFGQAPDSGNVYWSTYDSEYKKTNKNYAQSYWDSVPNLTNVTKIVGATSYASNNNTRFVYLFAITFKEGKRELVYVRYDLNKQLWDDELYPLEIPKNKPEFQALLCVCNKGEYIPPRLVIKIVDTIEVETKPNSKNSNEEKSETRKITRGFIYTRGLNADGTDWEDTAPQLFGVDLHRFGINQKASTEIIAAHIPSAVAADMILLTLKAYNIGPNQTEGGYYCTQYQRIQTAKVDAYDLEYLWDSKGRFQLSTNTNTRWVGNFEWYDQNAIYFVWKNLGGSNTKNLEYAKIRFVNNRASLSVTNRFTNHKLKNIVSFSGVTSTFKPMILTESTGWWPRSYLCYVSKTIDIFSKIIIQPKNMGVRVIEKAIDQQLYHRRLTFEWLYKQHRFDAQENIDYLNEASYFVPVYLATKLSSQKFFTEALDLFRLVFDYSQNPHVVQTRKITPFLTNEEQLHFDYNKQLDWLLDPLNPHTIAATRRLSYTKYTILALVKCFLDYASQQFSLDTVESVSKARTLYMTVLELLAEPALTLSSSQCEDKIGDVTVNLKNILKQKKASFENAIIAKLENINNKKLLAAVVSTLSEINDTEVELPNLTSDISNLVEDAIAIDNRKVEIASKLSKPVHNTIYTTLPLFEDNLPINYILNDKVIEQLSVVDLSPSYGFCISPNPIVRLVRMLAEVNLEKIRTCRNIAGMKRELEPYGAPTDQVSGIPSMFADDIYTGGNTIRPTAYRYAYLMERAKQLTSIAQQMEAAMLSAIEKGDAEAYNYLKATQEVDSASAHVKLQKLRVTEAKSNVKLSKLQTNRAKLTYNYYQKLLIQDVLAQEVAALSFQLAAIMLKTAAAAKAKTEIDSLSIGLSSAGDALSWTGNMLMFQANHQRRTQEWEHQLELADQEIQIGDQQIKIAEVHVNVVNQEKEIAQLRKDQAKDTVEFLDNKFTNQDLYEWMSEELEDIYSFFLYEATAVAKLAENQLAFERQQAPLNIIKADYWEVPTEGFGEEQTDRRGLTGSARLLKDIHELDQHAFNTNQLKLALRKTISLAQHAPIEFQRFRENGKLKFSTPMEMFDRDFPGHYVRLIRKVDVQVIGLIPPTAGIHAGLINNGISKAMTGNGILYQESKVVREPQIVALTSPRNNSGVFDLQQQSELLLPFEGLGVDTSWEFLLPKASNFFDYNSIADVLLTMEYTALDSYDYRKQLLETMRPTEQKERAFSIRHHFPDEWYDLHNPDQAHKPMIATLDINANDFPANLSNHQVQDIIIYFAFNNGQAQELNLTLNFTEPGQNQPSIQNPSKTTIDGKISTRLNARTWNLPRLPKLPFGNWEIDLSSPGNLNNNPNFPVFKNKQLDDILFVMSYRARTAEWVH